MAAAVFAELFVLKYAKLTTPCVAGATARYTGNVPAKVIYTAENRA